jgi:hypothetical protein
MPAIVVPSTVPQYGAGYLYKAPLGTAIPTNTVIASVFTDVWAAAWIPVGITREGSEFSYKIDTDQVLAAEYLDPLKIVTTGRSASVTFEMLQIHLGNLKTAFNGGTGTTTAVSGTTSTTLTKLGPPVVGQELRVMLGWESEDATERWIYYQCIQQGEVRIGRRKGSANAGIPVEFGLEQPSAGNPFDVFTAGVARVGT